MNEQELRERIARAYREWENSHECMDTDIDRGSLILADRILSLLSSYQGERIGNIADRVEALSGSLSWCLHRHQNVGHHREALEHDVREANAVVSELRALLSPPEGQGSEAGEEAAPVVKAHPLCVAAMCGINPCSNGGDRGPCYIDAAGLKAMRERTEPPPPTVQPDPPSPAVQSYRLAPTAWCACTAVHPDLTISPFTTHATCAMLCDRAHPIIRSPGEQREDGE